MSNRLRVSKHRRIKIENAIEKLIDMLDRAEPDPDLEPSLGSSEWQGWNSGADQTLWAYGNKDDREDEHDGCEPPDDDEPSLGATHSLNQKLAWAGGRGWNAGDDLEFDGETRPSADDEPSVGASSCGNQLHWAQGNRDDRELEDEREPGAGL